MDEEPAGSCLEILHSLLEISTPGALDRTCELTLGDVPQVVSVRGTSPDNPVLLFVHGGPGTPLSSTAWMWQRPVEEYFTVVHYDQRAAGRSYGLSDAQAVGPTLRPDQYISDLLELTEWVTSELAVDRVVVAGHSWGTVVATGAVLRKPDVFSVYLGIGQVVNFRQAESSTYDWLVAEAGRRADEIALAELESLAPYPGEGPLSLERIGIHRSWVTRYGGFAAGRSNCDYFLDGNVTSPVVPEAERDGVEAGNLLSAELVIPHLTEIDLTGVTEFPLPIVQFHGRHDMMTPPAPMTAWMESMSAPSKHVEWFENSAHMPMYEEPGHFIVALLEHVRPLAI